MRATRRQALAGALAVPAAAGLPRVGAAAGASAFVYDASVLAAPPVGARSVSGDPVRFAQQLFAARPATVFGVTRQADALLIGEVAQEAGYRAVSAPGSLGPHGWALALKS